MQEKNTNSPGEKKPGDDIDQSGKQGGQGDIGKKGGDTQGDSGKPGDFGKQGQGEAQGQGNKGQE